MTLDADLDARAAARDDYAGALVAQRYGDLEPEYEALDHSAALIDLRYRRLLAARGEDRSMFLNGQLTNRIVELKTGQGCPALLLTAQGRVVSILSVYDDGDRLLLAVDAADLERTRNGLERFLVADDCEFEDVGGYRAFALVGPQAAQTLVAAGAEGEIPRSPWGLAHLRAQGRETLVLARGDLRVPMLELYAVADHGCGADRALWRAVEEAGARPAGSVAYDTVRIESGTPRFGCDVDESHIALEARLEWAIHFAKGCYLGQEVIERAVSRGRVNRLLCLLAVDGAIAPGDRIVDADEHAVVTSAALSPRHGPICLAYLARDRCEPGTEVTIETSAARVRASVREWPRVRVLAGRTG